MMKKIAVGLVACWAVWQVHAADALWLTDLAKAQAKAKAENKLVLMDFNGSDWCPPCKALRKNVLSTQEFVDYAKKNLVLVDVDFPHTEQDPALKKANQALGEKYGIEGLPTVIVLSSDGKQLKKNVGYSGAGTKEFIADLEKLKKQG
jgi:thiol:disulfide interchange protein